MSGKIRECKTMDISYVSSRIQKICTDDKTAHKELGKDGAKILRHRLDQMEMEMENNLEALRNTAGNYHELTGDRKRQIACSLNGRNRLIFTPANDPRPIKPNGGLDWSKVTAVMNIEIVDYH
jgi:proteic killer suppression protein